MQVHSWYVGYLLQLQLSWRTYQPQKEAFMQQLVLIYFSGLSCNSMFRRVAGVTSLVPKSFPPPIEGLA